MRLVIVRHGQSTANAENRWQGQLDFDLSLEGKKQAESLGARFVSEGFNPKFVYSSPLKRAFHTAEISLPDKRVFVIDDLKESGIGVFEGLTMEEVREKYAEIAADFEQSRNFNVVPEAESRYELRKRAQTVVDFLVKGHSVGDDVVVFTHSGLMMFLVAVIMGTDRVWSLRIPNTSLFDFRLDNHAWNTHTSIQGTSGGVAQNGKFEIRGFADASHLI